MAPLGGGGWRGEGELQEYFQNWTSAMVESSFKADFAAEYGDDTLFDAADKLFDSMAKKQRYITGGLGQTCVGEAFLGDYDLPETSSYCETCADI